MKSTTTEIVPAIGTQMEGGYFGGIINVHGVHKGFVWAPKQAGQIIASLLPSGAISGAHSPNDCTANMQALLAAGSPAAQQIAELKIGGFEDWLIPSRDVLELGYRHFKPTHETNYCTWRDGENANSVPPGWLYTDDRPTQTSVEEFQKGGAEAFDAHWYASSTVLPSGATAFIQGFTNGHQVSYYLSSGCRVRAVRLIQLSS